MNFDELFSIFREFSVSPEHITIKGRWVPVLSASVPKGTILPPFWRLCSRPVNEWDGYDRIALDILAWRRHHGR